MATSNSSASRVHDPGHPLGAGEHQVAVQLVDAPAPPVRGWPRMVERDSRPTVKKCRPSRSDRLVAHQNPRTLLPRPSSSSEYTPMPSWPGSTATMPPPAAFGRHTDRADPVAGGVVHPAGHHHAQRSVAPPGAGHPPPGLRVDARRGPGSRPSGPGRRWSPAASIAGSRRQEPHRGRRPAHRSCPACRRWRGCGCRWPSPSGRHPRRTPVGGPRRPREVPDLGETLVGSRGGYQATEAIAPALIIGFFGVLVLSSTLISLNASPGGLHADLGVHGLLADLVERQGIGERLRYRLDGEFGSGVA